MIPPTKAKDSKLQRLFTQSEQVARSISSSSRKWGIAVAVIWSLICVPISQHQVIRNLELKATLPIEFSLRSYFEQDPEISPRLKIFLFDDNTFAYLKEPVLNLEQWGELLHYIGTHQPKAIFIDKIFGTLEDPFQRAPTTFEKLRNVSVPIYTGAFTSLVSIRGREHLDTSGPEYQLATYVPKETQNEGLPLAPRRQAQAYGATKEHQSVMRAGHIDYPGTLLVAPFLQLSDAVVLPHIAMFAADKIEVSGGKLFVNNFRVPVDDSGYLIPNFMSISDAYSPNRTRPLVSAMKSLKAGIQNSFLQPGDIVLILPSAFTGNADFKPTPYGDLPGGFIIATLISSVISGDWLYTFGYHWTFMLLMVFAGALVSLLRGVHAWIVGSLAPILICFCGMCTFILDNGHTPWPIHSLLFFSTSALVLTQRSRFESRRQQALVETERDYLSTLHQKSALEREKSEAAEIAAAFIPEPFPTDFAPYKVTGYHRCFDAASGDWYFFDKSPNSNLFHFVMCDITGHGVQAAIVVSTCRSVLSMLKINRPDSFARSDFVLQFTNVLNQVLYSQGKGSHTTTLCGVTFDSEKNKVEYISCGHPPAFLFTPGEQKPTALVSRNNNLGLNVESSFLLQEKAFSPQQELVIYSDGIQVKGIHRIIAKYLEERETLGLEPEDCVDMVCRSDPQKEVMELQDDVSLVFIKYEA